MEKEIAYIYDIPKFTKKASLDNTREMLKRVGFDENKFKIIHVAGTNGKGSVCSYIANSLMAAGRQTGLFVSPHLVRINERIVINGVEVSDEIFEKSFLKLKKISEDMMADGFEHPSFFEFLFGMGMDIFNESQVEYIVLETGLGGRKDATNVFAKPILTVITSIGLDHTDILGDTYEQIAFEKAGIIKENVPVVFEDLREDVTQVILSVAKKRNAVPIYFSPNDVHGIEKTDKKIDFYISNKYYENEFFTVNSMGIYQIDNASLAAVAMSQLKEISCKDIYNGIKNTYWQGRMQQVLPGIIIDGAHNDDGINRFLESVKEDGCNTYRILLLSAVKDKHYQGMIEKICESGYFSQVITGCLNDKRALSKEHFIETFSKYDGQKATFCDNIEEAYRLARELKGEKGMLYIAGSLYLAGEVMSIIKGELE